MRTTPTTEQVDKWQKDMEALLEKAQGWGGHVKVNGNQGLASMTIDVVVVPPMVHRAMAIHGPACVPPDCYDDRCPVRKKREDG